MSRPPHPGSAQRTTFALLVLFTLGLAVSTVMILRTQQGGDAVRLLTKGWLMAREGIWIPFGNEAGGGGFVPGSLTSLLMGLPMMVWLDHRAPAVPVLGCHVVAYLLLDRIVRQELGSRARLVLAIVYWLNPWRVYESAWVDNSNYVFLTGAIHLWACWRQRLRPGLWPSAVLVASVGLTFQLHLDALILVIAAVLLWLRGYWKPHWGGVAIGTAVTLLALVPYVLAAMADPAILPLSETEDERYVGSGFVNVWPVFKGFSYWFRYAAIGGSSKDMVAFAFAPTFGTQAGALLDPIAKGVATVGAVLTVPLALAANLWACRKLRRARGTPARSVSGRTWMVGYALWVLISCLLANGLSPARVMWWHNLIALHAAVLPLVLWGDLLLRSRRAALVRRVLATYAVLALLVLVPMSLAGPHYRPGGRDRDRHGPWTDRALLIRQGIEQPFEWERPGSNRMLRELGVPGEGPPPEGGG